MGVTSEYKYEVGSMQGLLQMLVYLTSRGYYHYCVMSLPEKKKERWPQIDRKLIAKYGAAQNKWERHRNRVYEKANFFYLRFENVAVILHTTGTTNHIPQCDDKFQSIFTRPMVIRITELTAFEIGFNKDRRVYVKLSDKTFDGLAFKFMDIIRNNSAEGIKKEFDILNGYPAWAGIIAQKRALARIVHKLCLKHQVPLQVKNLRINTIRRIYPVWKKEVL